MDKNVLIPLSLLERIIEFLEQREFPECHALFCDHCDILWTLKVKMQKLELRKAYANIIQATNKDDQHEARMKYLWQRSQIGNVDAGDFDF